MDGNAEQVDRWLPYRKQYDGKMDTDHFAGAGNLSAERWSIDANASRESIWYRGLRKAVPIFRYLFA